MLKFAIVVLVTVLLVVLVFLGGMWMGSRANSETVSNAEIHEKVNQESANLNKRFDAVDEFRFLLCGYQPVPSADDVQGQDSRACSCPSRW